MKKLVVCFFVSVGLLAQHPNFKEPATVQHTDIFLSFMRSGTNWLFTCIQALTHKPLFYIEHNGKNTYSLRAGINHLKAPVDHSKKPLYHSHIFRLVNQFPKNNRLLMIVRNYKEVFIRRVRDNAENYARLIQKKRQFAAYCAYLKVFDSWDPASRHLVYYEDLIAKPRETLKGVLDFLGESDHRLNEFMQNYESNRLATVQSYHKVQSARGGSMSRGEDVFFHSKQVPTELLRKTDNKMQAFYPALWGYLKRYKTPEDDA